MLDKGTSVGGYRIDGVLGQGGMGVVYEATQLSLDRKVALKLLAAHLGEDPQFRERFRREALIQAGIDHPHIVTVFEAGEAEEGLFMAMRLVRGPNLKDMIVSRELDAGRALRILMPIGEALDAAHEAGLIHRDIKPQNVLVSGRDHAYLADFGLTKAPGEKSLTKTGQFVGTLDYISPEQIRGLKATTASDIYAVAAVLYECLTGVVPYPKDSEAAVLFAHMSDEPPKVTDQRPELPAELDDVIRRAMSKEPAERHTSALELLRDAERAFGKRVRAAISPPGPLEGPEEAGIRPAEGQVRTRESRIQQSDELAAAAATAAGGPEATRMAEVEGTKLAETGDETKLAGVGDATQLATGADATRMGTAAGTPAAATGAGAVAPPPPLAPPVERRAGGGLIAGIVAAALVLAIVGFVVGGSGGGSGDEEPAGTSSASIQNLKLTFPDDWQETSGVDAPDELAFKDKLELAPGGRAAGGGLVAGQLDGSGPTLLPSTFLDKLPEPPPTTDTVKLGDLEAYRYRNLKPEGFDDSLTLYVVPNSGGVATVACVAPDAQATAFMPRCEAVAASLELRGADPLPLGPSQDYADAINGAVGKLNSARAVGRSRLTAARRPAGQAGAAAGIARAYAAAARDLRGAPVPPSAREANAAIVKALGQAGSAYERLGAGARRGDKGKYNAARAAVKRSEAALQRALDRLKPLGYTIT